MQDIFSPSTSQDVENPSIARYSLEDLKHLMHALSNKLVPITIFSELALRHCHDQQVCQHLDKIHRAVEEARTLVTHIQKIEALQSGGTLQKDVPTES